MGSACLPDGCNFLLALNRAFYQNSEMLKSFFFALPLLAIVAPAHAESLWLNDLPSALQQAAAQKKHVLLYFSGADGCESSKILKKEVFDTPAFNHYARNKFLMLEVQMPAASTMKNDASSATSPQMPLLAKAYGVEDAPLVLMLNPDAVVLGGFMGGHDSLSTVKGILNFALEDAVAINQKLSAAKALKGEAKARLLFEAYQALPKWIQKNAKGLLSQIKAADSADVLGLREAANQKTKLSSEMKRISDLINAASDNPNAVLAVVNAELEKMRLIVARIAAASNEPNAVLSLERENAVYKKLRPHLLSIKGNVMLYTANSLEDVAAAKACLLEFAKSHPDPQQSKQMYDEMLDFFANPAQLLQGVQAIREAKEAKPE